MATTSTAEGTDVANISAVGTAPFILATSQPGQDGAGDGSAPSDDPHPPLKYKRVKVHMNSKGVAYLLNPTTGTRYDVSDNEDVLDSTPPRVRQGSSWLVWCDGKQGGKSKKGRRHRARKMRDTLSFLTSSTDLTLPSPQLCALTSQRVQVRRHRGAPAGGKKPTGWDLRPAAPISSEKKPEAGPSTQQPQGASGTEGTLTDVSDVTPSSPAEIQNGLLRGIPGEDLLASLVSDIGPAEGLTKRQKEKFSLLQGMMSMTRRTLLTSTGVALGQRVNVVELGDQVRNLRDEFADRINALREGITAASDRIEGALENNVISTAGQHMGWSGARATVNLEPSGLNQSASGYTLSAPIRGPTLTVFEAFAAEKSSQIGRAIDRQLGDEIEAPSRLPKLKEPAQYSGEDDDDKFFTWLGQFCTWLQGNTLGGPKYNLLRILYLKGALTVHTLQWFNSDVEPLDKESDIPHKFEGIICAMHRQFVTSATAVRATKEFEAVRYDASRGIKFLVSELLCTANRMREPPADITIGQRFMCLIPASVHNKLVWRGLVPEYADVNMRKNHARTWIEAQGSMRDGGGAQLTTSRPAALTCMAPGPSTGSGPIRSNKSGPSTRVAAPANAQPRGSGPAMAGSTPKSTKTCFRCGRVGHIASDRECLQYNDSASSRPRPALRAQHIPSSCTDGEFTEDEVQQQDADYDGLWGGDQYDAEELLDDYPADTHEEITEDLVEGEVGVDLDPNEAPDLDNLIDAAQADEVRVGISDTPSHSTILDLDALLIDVAGDGLPLWTAAGENACPESPTDSGPCFDALHTDFEARHGEGPYSGTPAVELAAIGTVGAEENAHEGWKGVRNLQPGVVLGYSPAYLCTTAIDVEAQNSEFERHLASLQQAITDLEKLIARRESARRYIIELQTRPVGSQSAAPHILAIALARSDINLTDMSANLAELLHRMDRMRSAKRFIEEELTRRMLECERYTRVRSRAQPRCRRIPVIDLSPPPSYRSASPSDSEEDLDEEPQVSMAASRVLGSLGEPDVPHAPEGTVVRDSYSLGPITEEDCLPAPDSDDAGGLTLVQQSFSGDVWLPDVTEDAKWWVSHLDDPDTLEPHVLSQRVEGAPR
ncbi:hypothetical protein B0H16DRAFT_1469516 [Mycena metata]|uniref:CCHC-type domain-containing protein n=1 Tax=Mycena metata TaxID=1033252 RepID=A0AAD7HYX6_9AGAR|nr:hypothetical protein B0H16DRAFT_1469516 [Mycena metata]